MSDGQATFILPSLDDMATTFDLNGTEKYANVEMAVSYFLVLQGCYRRDLSTDLRLTRNSCGLFNFPVKLLEFMKLSPYDLNTL